MSEIEQFRADVEAFINSHSLTASRFGRLVANDGSLVFQLRAGREPRSAVRERVRAFMTAEANTRADTAA